MYQHETNITSRRWCTAYRILFDANADRASRISQQILWRTIIRRHVCGGLFLVSARARLCACVYSNQIICDMCTMRFEPGWSCPGQDAATVCQQFNKILFIYFASQCAQRHGINKNCPCAKRSETDIKTHTTPDKNKPIDSDEHTHAQHMVAHNSN